MGIIDVSDILGPGRYLLDTQVHMRLADPGLVEDGQFMELKIDFWGPRREWPVRARR